MCGFVGFIGGDAFRGSKAALLARSMGARIHHRGPDHSAEWIDNEDAVALAHKRLAIVDLSTSGEQPMLSASGRYVIIYNGELYNHMELRRELEESGHAVDWRGHSDTETLLAAIERWGMEGALTRSIGMFALALWDRQDKELTLARDRLGEKPLYYGWQGRGSDASFLFGSELKALAAHLAFEADIDRDAVAVFMRHNYIPAPYSIYRGIQKLLPGTFATLRRGERELRHDVYWSGADVAEAGIANPVSRSAEEVVEELEKLLLSAVGQQMMADVPLGAFLSGGVDSSLIVSLMQAQSSRPVQTFSIGFNEEGYNEAVHARAVASHLGTDHTELYVSPKQAMAVIPRLPEIYDEPFADSSQIPTHLVSELARRHVTVSLSGDGGDELFGGYNRYTLTNKFWKSISAIPRPLRGAVARGIVAIPPSKWDSAAKMLRPILPKVAQLRLVGDKAHKGAAVLASRSATDIYRGVVSHWRNPEEIVLGGREPATRLTGFMPRLEGLNEIERMMALDMLSYLPDDILVKVDRAAMAVSLETRVPFLDHRVVEFAWKLPLHYKIRAGVAKWPLRQILYKHVPKALVERPKMGFGVPIDSWLRGPLRGWAEELLDERRLREEGYLDPGPIRRMWNAHQGAEVNMQYSLWDVLMFQAWMEAQSRLRSDVASQPAPAAAVA
ncbi:MAG: asparagine synthase (glutamine-hydrolyzing) [Pseudomonadota bacterium]|nr:asparagine synthase (glutamine-hydrolyzing) [Pseudomonadota bacterium]